MVPMGCGTPYYAKAEKEPKKGYKNSITGKVSGATTPEQHKILGISYFKKGMIDEAVEELKLASEGMKEDGELRHYLGKAYYENGKYEESIAELLAAISNYMTNQTVERADAYNDLGLAYKEKQAHAESLSAFKESLELNPSVAGTNYNLGLLYYEKNMLDEAITYLKKSIKLDPKAADAHFMLGLIYYKKNLHDKSMD